MTAASPRDPTGGARTRGAISGTNLLGSARWAEVSGGSGGGATGTTRRRPARPRSARLFGRHQFESDRNYTVSRGGSADALQRAIPPQIRQARFLRDAAYYTLRETVDTTINTVKTEFYTVLVDKALIDIQNENLRLLQSQLTDQQNRFAAGTVPRFDVLQASVAVSNQRPQVITANNNFSLAYIGLARTLGIEYGPHQERTSPLNLVGNLDYHPQNFSADAGVAAGKANRALLKQQRSQHPQPDRGDSASPPPATSPRSVADGRVTRSRTTGSATTSARRSTAGSTGDVQLEHLRRPRHLRARSSRRGRCCARRGSPIWTMSTSSRRGHPEQLSSPCKQSKELIASQVLNVGEAEEAVRLAQARLSAGAGTQLDVLQSQTSLLQAQTTELQAQLQLRRRARQLRARDRHEHGVRRGVQTIRSPAAAIRTVSITTGTAPDAARQPVARLHQDTRYQVQRGSGQSARRDKINAENPEPARAYQGAGADPDTRATPKKDEQTAPPVRLSEEAYKNFLTS